MLPKDLSREVFFVLPIMAEKKLNLALILTNII